MVEARIHPSVENRHFLLPSRKLRRRSRQRGQKAERRGKGGERRPAAQAVGSREVGLPPRRGQDRRADKPKGGGGRSTCSPLLLHNVTPPHPPPTPPPVTADPALRHPRPSGQDEECPSPGEETPLPAPSLITTWTTYTRGPEQWFHFN